jgi:arylsulfatase A-like enzyme
MMRVTCRRLVLGVVASVVAAAAVLSTSACSRGATKPNVILIVVDSLRADALGAYGAAPSVSPHIDRLAAEGVRYERAIAQASWNLPSISSLITSAYPHQHGQGVAGATAGDVATLAEALTAGGYRTGAFVEADWPLLRRGFGTFSNMAAPHLYGDPSASNAAKTFGAAAEWIHGGGGGPYFALVHTYEVQSYFMAKPHMVAQATKENPSYKGHLAGWSIRDTATPVGPRVIETLLKAGPEDLAYVKGLYRGALADVDAQVGLLLATLAQQQLDDKTVVIVTSSNGEGFRPDLGRLHHGGRLHDDQLHVPLLIRWPKRLASGVVRTLVETVDVGPTVLALAGLAPEARFKGRVVVAAETGFLTRFTGPRFVATGAGRREAFAEESALAVDAAGRRVEPKGRQTALYSDWVKLISEGEKAELYDLKSDPQEEHDLAAAQARAVAALKSQLASLAGDASAAVDAETRDRLRSLGYVQ